MSEEAFLSWGWGIPFLVSVLLIVVGWIIRRAFSESPVFQEMQTRKKESAAPLKQLFKNHSCQVILTALIFIANNAAAYMLIAFFDSHATKPVDAGGLGMDRTPVLIASTVSAVFWLASTMLGGILSDKIGRVRTFQIDYGFLFLWAIPLFLLIDTGDIVWFSLSLIILASGLGLSYGPQAALNAEMFPAQVRYSGVSIGVYLMMLAAIYFVAVTLVKETRGIPLGISTNE